MKEGASDLHLSESKPPVIRVAGFLVPLLKIQPITRADLEGLLTMFLSVEKRKEFLERKEVNFAYGHEGKERFRGNAFLSLGKISIALRLVPSRVKTLEELNLPSILENFAKRQQGFFWWWVRRVMANQLL